MTSFLSPSSLNSASVSVYAARVALVPQHRTPMAPQSHTRGNFITNPRGCSLLLRGCRGRHCRIRRQSPALPGSYCLPPAVLIVNPRPSFYVLAPGIECVDCIGYRVRISVPYTRSCDVSTGSCSCTDLVRRPAYCLRPPPHALCPALRLNLQRASHTRAVFERARAYGFASCVYKYAGGTQNDPVYFSEASTPARASS